jgi:hypothetical protein
MIAASEQAIGRSVVVREEREEGRVRNLTRGEEVVGEQAGCRLCSSCQRPAKPSTKLPGQNHTGVLSGVVSEACRGHWRESKQRVAALPRTV